jgi:hypothetical protein
MMNSHRIFLGGIACAILCVTGCGPAEEEAQFSVGSGDTFGTLTDDRGDFTFRTGAGGAIESIDVDATSNTGTITLPDTSDGTNFAIARDAGGEIEFTPGGDQMLIAVRDDPTLTSLGIGDATFVVTRDQLGPFDSVLSARITRTASGLECTPSRDFLDDICEVVGTVTIDSLADSIEAELLAQDVTTVPRSLIVDLLNRYMTLLIDCCDAWLEYRDNGGDPC